jgi:ABC-type bacteriocin/lantibiotic exporter with double-glycine peptidase domain
VPLRPNYYPQTYPYSCVPACMKMVLSAYELEIPESRLRELCECDELGTKPSKAIEAAKLLGFEDSYSANLNLSEVRELLSEGSFPIVYLRFPSNIQHAVVVLSLGEGKVSIFDPADPTKTTIEESSFETMWRSMNNQAIIIKLASNPF